MPMKKRITPIIAVLALGAGTAFSYSGCAHTTGKSTGEFFDDAAITAKEKAALLKRGIHINVDTNNGVVALNGTVRTAEERIQAEQVARGVSGVTSVQNNLAIRP
jgi:hyperosmotically inducible periplasmic protein